MDSRLKTAAILAASIIIPDQITKAVIQSKYVLWDTDPVIPGFFNLVHVLNKGAACTSTRAAIAAAWPRETQAGTSTPQERVTAALAAPQAILATCPCSRSAKTARPGSRPEWTA
jgi:hypothetical protein